MRFSTVLPVAAALSANVASAQRNRECENIVIRENNPSINCETITGNVTVDSSVTGALSIEGPEEIEGSLIVNGTSGLLSLTSTTLRSIGGTFQLENLNVLSTLQMSALRSINNIRFINLRQLSSLTFGTEGVTRASQVRISDTFLSDLSGLKLASVDSFQIDNNGQLRRFSSDLVNITDFLQINANGRSEGMNVSMLDLTTAARISITDVSSFEVPSLETAGSLTFDTNPLLESFAAPNLTEVAQSITFTSNRELTNISFPELTQISDGDLTIIENAELQEFEFPELTRIFGGLQLAGNFESVDFPELTQVRGAVNVTSSTEDSTFCDTFNDLSDAIEGELECRDNQQDAVSEENGGTGSSGNGSGNNDDEDNAAGIVGVNMAILGVAAVAGLVQLL